VELADVPKEQWPKIARHYDLVFPDSGTQISFDFDNPALQHTLHHFTVPNAGSFALTVPEEPNIKVIQIDADCTDSAVIAK
jgi:hypothetical protein